MNILMSVKNKLCILLLLLFFVFLHTDAQEKKTLNLPEEVMVWATTTSEPWPADKYSSLKEAMIDNKFFIPLVFRGGKSLKLDSLTIRDTINNTLFKKYISEQLIKDLKKNAFKLYLSRKEREDRLYKFISLNYPENFLYNESQLPPTVVKLESIETTPFTIDLKQQTATSESVDATKKLIPDRRYWQSSFAADIKFSQNRSTANWHKGEINNINIYTFTEASYNYEKNKLSLSNVLTTTFTIVNAPNDTIRKYTVGSDELRLRSNFGLKAVKNWDYSSSAEFITAMSNKYISNSHKKNSAFLSPYTINFGLGMTYKPKPKFKKPDRSLNLNLSIEPLSFKYMYSGNKNINLGAHFQKDEEGNYMNILKTFGSTINMTQTTKFNKNLTWYSRLYYFTNYERVFSELENKFDIALSKYFSTTILIHLRFDDGVTKKQESDSYLQVNELFSFGFKYKW
jgi:Protein of unknown function (DUF3078).